MADAGTAVAGSPAFAGPAVAVAPASADALSVMDASQPGYGPAAVGDGVADDTVAIQRHLDAAQDGAGGRTVYFPAGTYKVSGTITVPIGVCITCGGSSRGGAGAPRAGYPGTATLLAADGFTNTVLTTAIDPAYGGGGGTTISNLRVAGWPAAPDKPSVEIKPRAGWRYGNMIVRHCHFLRSGASAIRWLATGEFLHNYIRAHDVAGGVGLDIQAVDSKFVANDITSSGDCVVMRGAAHVFLNNACYGSVSGAGLRVLGRFSAFVGNRLSENAGPGIRMEGPNNTVAGNTIFLNGTLASYNGQRVGVHLLFGWQVALSGNYFGNTVAGGAGNTQQYGVAITGSVRNCAVMGNTFVQQAAGGVLNVSSGTGNVITGNAGQP